MSRAVRVVLRTVTRAQAARLITSFARYESTIPRAVIMAYPQATSQLLKSYEILSDSECFTSGVIPNDIPPCRDMYLVALHSGPCGTLRWYLRCE